MNRTAIFDIETDGLLDECTKIHSLVIYDYEYKKIKSFADQDGYHSINEGLGLLSTYDRIVGHNIICFDLPVIAKLKPDAYGLLETCEVFDTLNAARLVWTNLSDLDHGDTRIPKELKGSHSLKAYGYRVGMHKDSFGEDTDWKHWSKEMQRYCEKDVVVSKKLYDRILKEDFSQTSFDLEMDFQKFIHIQERNGVHFDKDKAKEMLKTIDVELSKIDAHISAIIPPTIKPMKRVPDKVVPFNANSTTQMVKFFQEKYKWKHKKVTKTNRPAMDEEVLSGLIYPEAELFLKRKQVKNIEAKLQSGDKSWLNFLTVEGKIHGRVNTNGAVTGRCCHAAPNLSQVTSARKYMGKEARSLFIAPPGFKMVGCDASGLELRMLAHYLAAYDDGEYTKIVVDDDVHTANQVAAGLSTRDDAKRFIYAHNYGAGDELLGKLILPDCDDEWELKRMGADIRSKFKNNIKGLGTLIEMVQLAVKMRGYLRGLDGRKLLVRSKHRALNTLLQGAGAVVMKKAAVIFWDYCKSNGWDKQGVVPCLNVHDEFQFYVPEDIADLVGAEMPKAIIQAGIDFNLKCPLDGEYKVGNNWMQTH